MEKRVIDTSIAIEMLKGRIPFQDNLYITQLSIYELYFGSYKLKRNIEILEKFLANVQLLPSTNRTMKLAARIKLKMQKEGKDISTEDLLIASNTLEFGFSLWTLNKKHFEQVPNLILYK